MGLSNELISAFVKVTKDSQKTKRETIMYGTVVEQTESEGDEAVTTHYVKLDGSDLLTPITSTVDIKDGERVTVMIKNHTATVTGNITSPAARTGDVQKINDSLSGKDPDSEMGKVLKTFIPADTKLGDSTTIGRENYESADVNKDTYVLGNDVYIGSKKAKKTAFRPYYRQGDAIFVPMLYTSGFASGFDVYFFIPLSKPIIGEPVITITHTDGIKILQNGFYKYGSASDTYVKPSSYSCTLCPGGLSVKATFSSNENSVDTSPCGIIWNGTITLA